MTDRELADQAWQHVLQSTISGQEWQKRVTYGYKGKPYNAAATELGKARALLDQIGAAPAPAPMPDPPPAGTLVDPVNLQAAVDAAKDGDVLLVKPGTVTSQIHVWAGITRRFQIRAADPSNPPVFVGGAGAGLYCLYTEAPIVVGPGLVFSSRDGYGVGFRANTANIDGGSVTGCRFDRNAITGLYQGTQPGRTHSNFRVDNCSFVANGQRLDLDPHTPDGDGEHSCYIGGGEGVTVGATVADCVSEGQLHGQAFQGGGGLRDSTFIRCTAKTIRATPGLPASSFAGFGIFSSFQGTSGVVFDGCVVDDCDGYGFKAVGGATGMVRNSRTTRCRLGGLYGLADGGGNSFG